MFGAIGNSSAGTDANLPISQQPGWFTQTENSNAAVFQMTAPQPDKNTQRERSNTAVFEGTFEQLSDAPTDWEVAALREQLLAAERELKQLRNADESKVRRKLEKLLGPAEAMANHRLSLMFNRLDHSARGTISKQVTRRLAAVLSADNVLLQDLVSVYPGASDRFFEVLDSDDDGSVTRDEWEVLFEEMIVRIGLGGLLTFIVQMEQVMPAHCYTCLHTAAPVCMPSSFSSLPSMTAHQR